MTTLPLYALTALQNLGPNAQMRENGRDPGGGNKYVPDRGARQASVRHQADDRPQNRRGSDVGPGRRL